MVIICGRPKKLLDIVLWDSDDEVECVKDGAGRDSGVVFAE